MILGILFGLLGGVMAGMGMGGGTLLIPLLLIFLDFNQLQAQTINLLAFLPTALVSLIIHSKNHLVEFKRTYILAFFGIVGAICGAFMTTLIESNALQKLFGLFLISIGVYQLVQATNHKSSKYLYFKNRISKRKKVNRKQN